MKKHEAETQRTLKIQHISGLQKRHWKTLFLWLGWRDQSLPKVLVQGLNRDFSGSRSHVIRSFRVHLWCSPSAGCSQSAGRRYKEAAVPLLSWLCVFGESTPSVGSVRFLLGWVFEILFVLASFCTFCFPPDQWLPLLWFLSPVFFCLSLILIESVGGCGFYSHHHLLEIKRPVCFDLLCELCRTFVSFPTCDPVPVLQALVSVSFLFHKTFFSFSTQNESNTRGSLSPTLSRLNE